MIIARKPLVIFDVDLFGVGALGLLLAAGWFLVVAPWQQVWSEHTALSAGREQVESRLQSDIRELERFDKGLEQLRAAVESQAGAVPDEASLPQVLREMTSIAQAADVEIQSVAPQPARHQGPYRISDIDVTGRGTSREFIRFLDLLAQRNPHHALRACMLTRAAESPDARCELSWTLRLYLLPRLAAGSGG